MAANARRLALQHSWEVSYNTLVLYYDRLIECGRRGYVRSPVLETGIHRLSPVPASV